MKALGSVSHESPPTSSFHALLKHSKSWLLLIIGVVIAYGIYITPPRLPPKQKPTIDPLAVETLTLRRQKYTIYISSYGRTQPRRQIELTPQVGGKIVSVSPNFRQGGVIKSREILLTLDKRDYLADVKIAKANLIAAQQRLLEEEALSETALHNWEQHKSSSKTASSSVSALTLRQPQLKSAKASVQSAEAALQKAQLALERCDILAPFDGRIEEIFADIGQVVVNNRLLARLHSSETVIIRLPITQKEWQYISPSMSTYRPSTASISRVSTPPQKIPITVAFSLVSDLENNLTLSPRWLGEIVAIDSFIDNASQQLHAIAEINLKNTPHPIPDNKDTSNPQGTLKTQPFLAIGQYLNALIKGQKLNDAIVIPNEAIYQGKYVYRVVNQQLQRTPIAMAWQNDEEALISMGLQEGDQVVISPIEQEKSGMPVRIVTARSPPKLPQEKLHREESQP